MALLAGRRFLLVGGNGYVGSFIAARLIQNDAQVSVLSRHGPRYDRPENSKINWLIGSALNPEQYRLQINEADTIIHTVGTLFDTSITKFRAPGDAGTYEQMNRDALLKVLSVLDRPKKVFYLSAVGHPPFIPRYETTKKQAQDALLASQNEGYVLKPGVVYNWETRKWSIPLRYMLKAFNAVYPYVHGIAPRGTFLQKFLREFLQAEPSSLEQMADAVLYISMHGCENKLLFNQDFARNSELFQNIKRDQEHRPKQQ